MLNNLLWKGKSRWQIVGASIGSFIGLFLLMMSLQLYLDLDQLMNGGDHSDEYVLINKRVNLFNTLGASSSFTEEEIDDIKDQDFVENVGIFTPNKYKVSASSSMLGFYTELFFESVPNNFVDVNVDDWGWETGQSDLPIILSRDYLALYNFGFAPSQGLPQFTQNTIKKVTIDITVKGKTQSKVFKGRIAGFSDRINSILVPQDFMEYANSKFGNQQKTKSSRLILVTNNPYSKELQEYLEDNNFEVSSGRLIGGQVATLLKTAISIIAAIGFFIVLLSILIFILNFQLIISKSSADIKLLAQLGYKNGQISMTLIKNLAILFTGILMLTLLLLLISRPPIVSWFKDQGFYVSNGLDMKIYLCALLFSILFLVVNYTNIKRNVLRCFVIQN